MDHVMDAHDGKGAKQRKDTWKTALICLLLAAAIAAMYWKVTDYPFIHLDDNIYVSTNPHVSTGLSADNVRWSFALSGEGEGEKPYWHPLSWLSHMLDCQLFGLDAGMHHLSNVVYHILNTILLFLALRLMTGSLWKSAFVASLFALHPVNVDSVAWITERKNLLSTTFWLLTMIAYWFYVQKPTLSRYCMIVLAFCLGLLSKPMLITLPFALLLLDYWPLKRIRLDGGKTVFQELVSRDAVRLVLEKAPLIVISIIFGYITIHSLSVTDQMTADTMPMALKVKNALVSYAVYMAKMVWPTDLTIFHPFPVFVPAWKVFLSFSVILIITSAAAFAFRSAPYFIVGWLWFLGTLVTVSGIVQGGLWPAYAERWVYVPYIGLFIAMTWGCSDLLKGLGQRALILASTAAAVMIALSVLTWFQISLWQNDVTLFTHSLEIHPENNAAHSFLGAFYLDEAEYGKALPHYVKAHELIPGNPYIANNLGVIYMRIGKTDEAIRSFQDALQVRPDLIYPRVHIGNLLLGKGEIDQAISQYNEVLRNDPQNAEVYNSLGNAYRNKSDLRLAAESYNKALQLRPGYMEAEDSLRKIEGGLSGNQGGMATLEQEIQAGPGDPMPFLKLAAQKQQQGDHHGALAAYRKALSIKPDSAAAMYGMVLIHAGRQEFSQAIQLLQSMRKIQPDNPENYYNLACMYARWGKPDEAVSWLKQAVDHGFGNVDLIRKDPDLAGIRDTEFVRGLIASGSPAGK